MVHAAAVASRAPLEAPYVQMLAFRAEGRPADAEATPLPTVFDTVTDEFFTTVGTPLLRGRAFQRRDQTDARRPVIINESMARHYFGDDDPIERSLWLRQGDGTESEPYTIVGVVADSHANGLTAEITHTVYEPIKDYVPTTVLVRTAGEPAPVAPDVVESIRQLDPNRPIDHIQTLAELRAETLAPQRLNALLFGSFALLALLIAVVGVAGVLAFAVTQRRRELAIRATLGAEPGRVLGMILREGGGLAAVGIALGAAGALGLSGFLAGLLFEVAPADPITFAAAGVLLAAVALVASWLPARRAMKVDPIEALRSE
jgi:putative ABC transport system permease protein